MIIGLFHPGSGLGDQLFCYLGARITAERLDVPFTMVGKFKGDSFMKIKKGEQVDIPHHIEYPAGKIVIDNDFPVYEGERGYDPEFDFIEDNTIIDGCRLQDERYWDREAVSAWIGAEYKEDDLVPDDVCVIGFRGGEFYSDPDLGLPKEYYDEAIRLMRESNPDMKFEVHTDDVGLANQFFPDFECVHDMETNWRAMRSARHAIIANSAFYVLPRWIRGGKTIAPRYWARRNIKQWSLPQNYYKSFFYI